MRRKNWWINVRCDWYFTGGMELECGGWKMSHSFCCYMRTVYHLECFPFMVCTFLANGKPNYIQTRWNICSGTFSQTVNAIGYFPMDLYPLYFPWAFYSLLFPHSSHVLVTWRRLIRSYPLPFPCPFVSIMFLSLPFHLCVCSLIYICCSFRRHSICRFS